MIRIHIIPGLLLLALIVACGDDGESQMIDTTTTSELRKDSIDTLYRFDGYQRIILEIRKHGQLVSTREFRISEEKRFDSNSALEWSHEYLRGNEQENYKSYYPNGKVSQNHYVYSRDAMGGTQGERIYYDSIGNLDSVLTNVDYIPEGATGHLDICGTVTSRYYVHGILQRVTRYDIKYEALSQCPCGSWEYYDSTGKLLRTEKYKTCGDGKTDCEYVN